MKFLSILLLIAAGALAGCSTTANNSVANNANIRGTNTNTGYMTNSETNVKPTIPANVTNISPPSMNTNSNANSNSKANTANKANSNKP